MKKYNVDYQLIEQDRSSAYMAILSKVHNEGIEGEDDSIHRNDMIMFANKLGLDGQDFDCVFSGAYYEIYCDNKNYSIVFAYNHIADEAHMAIIVKNKKKIDFVKNLLEKLKNLEEGQFLK